MRYLYNLDLPRGTLVASSRSWAFDERNAASSFDVTVNLMGIDAPAHCRGRRVAHSFNADDVATDGEVTIPKLWAALLDSTDALDQGHTVLVFCSQGELCTGAFVTLLLAQVVSAWGPGVHVISWSPGFRRNPQGTCRSKLGASLFLSLSIASDSHANAKWRH